MVRLWSLPVPVPLAVDGDEIAIEYVMPLRVPEAGDTAALQGKPDVHRMAEVVVWTTGPVENAGYAKVMLLGAV